MSASGDFGSWRGLGWGSASESTLNYMAEPKRERVAWGTLTTEVVVDAALELIEKDGIDSLSIRLLADHLGVGRMALYRHIDNKEELLHLVVNRVAEKQLLNAVSPELSWQEELRSNARLIRQQLRRYPGLAHLLLKSEAVGTANRCYAEQLLSIFARAGFTPDDIAVCYLTYVDTVVGRVYRETSGDFASKSRMRLFIESEDPERPTPILSELARQLEAAEPDSLFENMLDVMIDGFAARLTNA